MSQTENAPAASTATPAASLLDEIVEATRLKPGDDGFAATRDGLQAFLKELVAQPAGETKVSPALVDSLLASLDELMQARVVIAVAGMEGALASVVGGLVDCPVIAVPTSVGYGASFGGLSALLAMLNSCASGCSVVNIDNGFGAGFLASRINQMEGLPQ